MIVILWHLRTFCKAQLTEIRFPSLFLAYFRCDQCPTFTRHIECNTWHCILHYSTFISGQILPTHSSDFSERKRKEKKKEINEMKYYNETATKIYQLVDTICHSQITYLNAATLFCVWCLLLLLLPLSYWLVILQIKSQTWFKMWNNLFEDKMLLHFASNIATKQFATWN